MTLQIENSARLWRSRAPRLAQQITVDCGWGRLLFGQTFDNPEDVAAILCAESSGRRDVALYVRDPHIVLAAAPQELFLDPSHSFRIWLRGRSSVGLREHAIKVRAARADDEADINRLYLGWNMVPLASGYVEEHVDDPAIRLLVAENQAGDVTGVVMGVDHHEVFNDPANGSSLWALAVDAQCPDPGVGECLVTALADLFLSSGREFMDLSVMHDNHKAIALYEKLGFQRIAAYCVKKKNPINEKLFIGPEPDSELNVYARIIVDEARRRGVSVKIEDASAGLFRLTLGGRSVACRESLSEFTSSVAMSRCADKRLTHKLLTEAGLSMPAQRPCDQLRCAIEFLDDFERVVVKPASGEQGHGVSVDLRTPEEVEKAFAKVQSTGDTVLVEELVEGQDLRVIVIDEKVVAAAVRRPPVIRGDGRHSIAELIEKLNRRRMAATNGESRVPMDEETRRCITTAGYGEDDVLAEGVELTVRNTANLHTGGTIEDVTEQLHEKLGRTAVQAAQLLDIPVVGLDFIVPDPSADEYKLIEANERPGLANHEPQPTAERFMDFLFPQTRGAIAP